MPQKAFWRLADEVEGRIILVNMYRALSDRSQECLQTLERGRLHAFFTVLASRLDALNATQLADSAQVLSQVYRSAWDRARLLRKGLFSTLGARRFVVFKSLEQVTALIEHEQDDPRIANLLRKSDKVFRKFDDVDGAALEKAINRLPEDAPLFLSIRADVSDPNRRCSVWYTREAEFARLCDGRRSPSKELATAARNWLGLGHVCEGMPIFAFRAITDIDEILLTRPSPLDAINQPWFKYRPDAKYPGDNWGRAVDLTKLAAAEHNMDGGPEAVGRSLPAPRWFDCTYLGKVGHSEAHPGQHFVTAIAKPDEAHELIRRLHDILWPAAAVLANGP